MVLDRTRERFRFCGRIFNIDHGEGFAGFI
jgi:hypothetical protein